MKYSIAVIKFIGLVAICVLFFVTALFISALPIHILSSLYTPLLGAAGASETTILTLREYTALAITVGLGIMSTTVFVYGMERICNTFTNNRDWSHTKIQQMHDEQQH